MHAARCSSSLWAGVTILTNGGWILTRFSESFASRSLPRDADLAVKRGARSCRTSAPLVSCSLRECSVRRLLSIEDAPVLYVADIMAFRHSRVLRFDPNRHNFW